MRKRIIALLISALLILSCFAIYAPIAGATPPTTATKLSTTAAYDRNPSFVEASSGKWWLFWARSMDNPGDRGSGYDPDGDPDGYEIVYRYSTNEGSTWAPETVVPGTANGVRGLAVFQDTDGKIWLIKGGSSGTDHNLYYNTTTDGSSWSGWTLITTPANPSGIGCNHLDAMIANDGKIWVFYESGGPAVDAVTSTDHGVTWADPISVAAATAGVPKAMQDSSGNFRVVYTNAGNSIDQAVSATGAAGTWSSSTIVSSSPGSVFDYDPCLYEDSVGIFRLFWAPWNDPGLGGDDTQWIDYISSSDGGLNWANQKTWATPASGMWAMWPEVTEDSASNIVVFWGSEASDADIYIKAKPLALLVTGANTYVLIFIALLSIGLGVFMMRRRKGYSIKAAA